ncbi:MAG: hypothetical protein NT175_07855 [Bacteroidetes bacterium]|nr:hypothetical protein [Bacteroidota bacterium]
MMRFKLVKLNKISGAEASVYSIYIFDEKKTLFDIFIEENKNLFKSELNDIFKRLKTIGHRTGAREQFFKIYEGKLGDGLCALFDTPNKNLRLYCIRYGSSLIIVGGGGFKPKSIDAFQDDDKLKTENFLLRRIAGKINKRIKDGDLEFDNDGKDLIGDIEFYEEDYE